MKKQLHRPFLLILLAFAINLKTQAQELQYRSVQYYLDSLDILEVNELKQAGLINDSLQVVEKYREPGKDYFNDSAFYQYSDIKMKVMMSLFKDYLYQQHLYYADDVYVLYFSIVGFDDAEWQIVKWNKSAWNKKDKIDKRIIDSCTSGINHSSGINSCKKIAFNYDEGPKNMDSVHMFIKNNYLILERGGLYHSLYDLKNNKLLYNEESPWHAAGTGDKKKMNKWIRKNLHDKILATINNVK